MKLFSIRVKELFEPIVLRKQGDGFLLFLKAFSWKTDLWITLGDFTVKQREIGNRNLYLTENRFTGLVETKYGVRQVIKIIWVTYVQKNF